MTSDIVLSCDKLVKTFSQGPQTLQVLRGIDFSLARGERIAIVGASGSGKSTLLNMLGGLDQASSGSVSVMGRSWKDMNETTRGQWRNRYLGFVYQFHHLLPEFTALENVMMPLLIAGNAKAAAKQQAAELLAKVGLEQRVTHRPAELSGGERQRVAIARALVGEPACVLLDEPTGNLDTDTAERIQQLLITLNEQLHISFLVVTHDPKLAGRMHRVMELAQGELTERRA
jgi:lipoprotein-releasing system ATP-binding protein